MKSLPGADCDSDHILVMCTFQLKREKLRKAMANPKFQMDLIKSDEKLRDKIAIAVHNNYETLNNMSKVEELWSEIKNSLNKVIEKNVPRKDNKENKKWINKEILDLMEERRKSNNAEAKTQT
ncbi:endonuclease-reverse transcriptase [Plakobranchus ocellatus]|uniref:Endonuclease-reverse transcriptase n=1 Tax=Plakobranchus ocellatus TaxID=259542 RepID=A0AAV3YWG7_9GAST|nr:endonuclease-reverse transcriptase [Plakobranchus ocellatus]